MDIDIKVFKGFYNVFIEDFVIKDIERCVNAHANFVIALSLVSYTEHLGSLISGNLGTKGNTEVNFNKALEYFDFNGDPNYYKNFKVKDISDNKELGIYKIFRCGLIHEYFPMGFGSIIIHNEPLYLPITDAGVDWVNIKEERKIRFHCNAYFRDFRKAYLRYYNEVVLNNNNELFQNFAKSFRRIATRKFEEIS